METKSVVHAVKDIRVNVARAVHGASTASHKLRATIVSNVNALEISIRRSQDLVTLSQGNVCVV